MTNHPVELIANVDHTADPDVNRVHNDNTSIRLFSVNDRVYYEDLAGDPCTIVEVIEVSPWLEYVYKVRFDDRTILATTNKGLRPNEDRNDTQVRQAPKKNRVHFKASR